MKKALTVLDAKRSWLEKEHAKYGMPWNPEMCDDYVLDCYDIYGASMNDTHGFAPMTGANAAEARFVRYCKMAEISKGNYRLTESVFVYLMQTRCDAGFWCNLKYDNRSALHYALSNVHDGQAALDDISKRYVPSFY